ncbi:MAG: glutamate formimidoyltransferase [Defluviitaleaceae bacterium]|nr:glutamate formimidoyltransferase [Defluviitaleaceae bacterium]
MSRIIECIPNFSEGRNCDVLEQLAKCAGSFPGVTLLDYSWDESHNRSVYTLLGDPDGIAGVMFALTELASRLIDLTKHTGEHPRMGAIDVMPFVPIKNMTAADCVEISKTVGARIGNELGIPVYLYEDSCTAEHRRNLAAVRRGQFEGFPEKIKLPEWKPDFGPDKIHPTAGAVAVGARIPLIAFNVNLSTSDVTIADKIARIVRGSNGGLKYCKAIGVKLEERNTAQVSMNMVNYEGTPLYRAVELIRAEAARYGVSVIGTELIGLSPAKALIDCAEYYLQIENFNYEKQVLDNHY